MSHFFPSFLPSLFLLYAIIAIKHVSMLMFDPSSTGWSGVFSLCVAMGVHLHVYAFWDLL